MKWDKLDKEIYSDIVSESIKSIDIGLSSACQVDVVTRKVNDILEYAATQAALKGKKLKRRTSKLRVWIPEIKAAAQTKKEAFHKWKQAGRPEDPTNRAVQEKKLTNISLRRAIRFEYSKKHIQIRQEILDSRTRDSKLFHKLIN